MKIIQKDILTVEKGIICHQCNCQGSMGAGIALSIAQKWPKVLREYKSQIRELQFRGQPLLGSYSLVEVSPGLVVANILGQEKYGRGGMYTSYQAVEHAFMTLQKNLHDSEEIPQVYVPFLMGCNRGGGNWDTYSAIIEKYFPDVIYCKLGKV